MAKIELPKKFVSKYPHKFAAGKKLYLRGKRILPKPITGKESLPDLIDNAFLAYNGARMRAAHDFVLHGVLAMPSLFRQIVGPRIPVTLGTESPCHSCTRLSHRCMPGCE